MKETPKTRFDERALFQVQEYEDKTNEAVMVLESNAENMESLYNFYRMLVKEEGFPAEIQESCSYSVKRFCLQLHELIYDVKMQIRRANVLVKTVSDRKTIVSHNCTPRSMNELLTQFSSYNFSKLKLQFVQKGSPQRCGVKLRGHLRKPSLCGSSPLSHLFTYPQHLYP